MLQAESLSGFIYLKTIIGNLGLSQCMKEGIDLH